MIKKIKLGFRIFYKLKKGYWDGMVDQDAIWLAK